MLKNKNGFGRRFPFIFWMKQICPDWMRPLARNIYIFCNRFRIKLVSAIHIGYATLNPDRAKLYCPCCNSRFVTFTDRGYKNRTDYFDPLRYESCRQDVICPLCLSLPRHRILSVWCEKSIDKLRGKRILYFAPENGMVRVLKRNKIAFTTADLFNEADLKLDLDHIDQPDASWDVVFCNHVLEHVPDYKKALRELYRILKPGGMLICSFPIDIRYETVQEDDGLVGDDSPQADRERIRKFGQKDHLRVFGRDSRKLLEEAGFVVSVIDGDTMPEEIMPVVGPADYDSNKLFECKKC